MVALSHCSKNCRTPKWAQYNRKQRRGSAVRSHIVLRDGVCFEHAQNKHCPSAFCRRIATERSGSSVATPWSPWKRDLTALRIILERHANAVYHVWQGFKLPIYQLPYKSVTPNLSYHYIILSIQGCSGPLNFWFWLTKYSSTDEYPGLDWFPSWVTTCASRILGFSI